MVGSIDNANLELLCQIKKSFDQMGLHVCGILYMKTPDKDHKPVYIHGHNIRLCHLAKKLSSGEKLASAEHDEDC